MRGLDERQDLMFSYASVEKRVSKDQRLSVPDEKGKQSLSKTSTFLGVRWQSIVHQFRSLYESALHCRGSEGSTGSLNPGDAGDATKVQAVNGPVKRRLTRCGDSGIVCSFGNGRNTHGRPSWASTSSW